MHKINVNFEDNVLKMIVLKKSLYKFPQIKFLKIKVCSEKQKKITTNLFGSVI